MITLEGLQELLKGEGLRYYLIPDQDGVVLSMVSDNQRYQFRILVEEDGRFLQFRSDAYLFCPRGHPNLETVLQVLGAANYRLRLLKFGWDPTDGEIAVYADLWLMDGELTQRQFGRMADAYMAILDGEYANVPAAVENGTFPAGMPGGDGPDPEIIDEL